MSELQYADQQVEGEWRSERNPIVCGVRLPPGPNAVHTNIGQDLRHFRTRSDDVFVVTYPKSGELYFRAQLRQNVPAQEKREYCLTHDGDDTERTGSRTPARNLEYRITLLCRQQHHDLSPTELSFLAKHAILMNGYTNNYIHRNIIVLYLHIKIVKIAAYHAVDTLYGRVAWLSQFLSSKLSIPH